MPFGLTKDHHDFYHENHFIEFEDLLSPSEMDRLEEEIDHVGEIKHDLWRESPSIKKITLKKDLAEIASNLCKKRPLRIAYDQIITEPLSKEPLNLIEMSAIRKIVCGLVLQIDTSSTSEEPLVPKIRGSGVFFSPFQELIFPKDCHLFLIAYTEETSLYIQEKRDPHLHALKKLGYGFGDKLLSTTHPIVYRT